MSGVTSVTATATDPGGLTASNTFTITVNPAGGTTPPPNAPFSITGVTTVNCQVLSGGQRRVSFTPRYAGVDGSPVSFSVVNELLPTTAPGPYSLDLYTDNPMITLSALQSGVSSTFGYNWLAACTPSAPGARVIGTGEGLPALTMRILNNPTFTELVEVEIQGAEGQPLKITTLDSRGQLVSEQMVPTSKTLERQTVRIGQTGGLYFIQISTPTKAVISKILKQ